MASILDLGNKLRELFGGAVNQAQSLPRQFQAAGQMIQPHVNRTISNLSKSPPTPIGTFSRAVNKIPQVNQINNSFLQSPLGSFAQGKPQEFLPRLQTKISSANKFAIENPSEFANMAAGAFGPASISKVSPKIKFGSNKVGSVPKPNTPELPSEMLGFKPPPTKIVAPKKVGYIDQGLNRVRNVIEKQGEAGKEIARRLQATRDLAEVSAGGWVSRMPTVNSLSKAEFVNFVDASEGKAKPLNQKVAQALNEWTGVRSEIYQTAKSSGLDIGKLENYFPHRFDPKMFEGDNFVKAVQHLVETKQAATTDEAAKMLRYAQDTVRNRRHGNLEIERIVNLPGYEKTKDALLDYISSASDRISQVKNFGQNDDIAMELINRVGQEGFDASATKNLFDIAIGAKQYGDLQGNISQTLRSTNALTKLGLGAITNTGQNLNTATVTGLVRTIVNVPKAAMSQEAKDFALKTGVTLDTVINSLKEGAGYSGVAGKLGAPGFNKVEKFNRTLAAVAGRDYARELAKKGDAKTLAKMGITLKGNKLTPEQEIQAARNIVERTQFKVDPQDLPGWSSSPWGRVLTQFKSFSYNQSAFLGREIIEPALKDKNFAPLLRFVGVGIPLGMGIQTIKNVARNRKDEENPAKRAQQGFSQVGGLGLGGDIVTGLFPMNGKYLDPNRATTMALSTLAGPTVGTAIEGYGSVANAIQGKPENLGRFALKQIPVLGGTLQNTLLPYKSATGEENRRFGGTAQASEFPQGSIVQPSQLGSQTMPDLTPVQTAQLKEQITQINAKQKEILNDNGFLGFGGSTDDEKNAQLFELENQKTNLEEQLKTPEQRLSKDKELNDAQYTYLAENLKRSGDIGNWVSVTEGYVKYLEDYQSKIKDPADKIRVQNKIEDLKVSLGKYAGYGGFKKPKKAKKVNIRFPKGSTSKVTIRKSVIKAPNFKLKSMPTFKISRPKTSSIKLSHGTVSVFRPKPFRNTLTGS